MKTFVVAYVSFYDNELKQEIVQADSTAEAMVMSSFIHGYSFTSLDDEVIKSAMFNADILISAMEVKLCSCPTE